MFDLIFNIAKIEISKIKIKVTNVIIGSKLNQKRNYDKNHVFIFLKKRILFLFSNASWILISLSKNMIVKWFQRRIKSFKITKKIESLIYEFEILDHWKIHSVISIQQLKSAFSDKDFYDRDSYNNSFSIYVKKNFDDEFYVIKKLINKKIIRKNRDQFTQYLIR